MITDANLTLSGSSATGAWVGQLVTAVGNNVSTNVLDLGSSTPNQPIDLGMGEDMSVVIGVVQTLTSAGAATVQIQYVEADDAAITTNVTILAQTDAIPFASLVAGTQLVQPVPHGAPFTRRRYAALRYVVGTAALTNATGQFIATIVHDVGETANTLYKSGFTVL